MTHCLFVRGHRAKRLETAGLTFKAPKNLASNFTYFSKTLKDSWLDKPHQGKKNKQKKTPLVIIYYEFNSQKQKLSSDWCTEACDITFFQLSPAHCNPAREMLEVIINRLIEKMCLLGPLTMHKSKS